MKKTLSIAFAAFALFAFTSCQKENLISENQEPARRIVTAVFEDNGTKTTLGEDDTPLWKVGDVIRILDGSTHEDITITKAGRTITFETGLHGAILYAVYPASATSLKKCIDGSITFTIPEIQDGTFGSANICVAKGDDKDNLVFSNVTSVLEFSQTASNGVLRVCATADNAIAGTLTATFGEDNKATVSASGLTGKTIWTTAPAEAASKYYVAVAPVETGDVTFRYYKELKDAEVPMSGGTLSRNTIYTLGIPSEESYYENSYVEITMTVGGVEKTYKWAKCNIGATKETDYGDYYAWGTTVKAYSAVDYSKTTGAFTFVPSNPYGDIYKNTWNASAGFSWNNTPFTNGVYSDSNKKVFTKYVPSSMTSYQAPSISGDNKTVLDLPDDVANKVLGGNWRMPTNEEFDALLALSKSWQTNYKGSGVNGYLFTANGKSIFLPAAGHGEGTGLNDVGNYGSYWSSSLNTNFPNTACYLNFNNANANTTTNPRSHGRSVRALYEEPTY